MPRNRTAIWLLVSMMWAGVAVAETKVADEQEDLRGVLIEEIPKSSSLGKAGLQVGDVILSWERLPNPPANPEAAKGAIVSYFDWRELEVEQVPRGTVVLRGRRDEAPLDLVVEPGLWEVKVQPMAPQALAQIYLAGKAQAASGDAKAAVEIWRTLASAAESEHSIDLRVWITLQIGDTWEKNAEWHKAEESFREAVRLARTPSAQVDALVALGKYHEQQSGYEAAREAYASALKIGQAINPESLNVANSLTHLGLIAWGQGVLDTAQEHFRQGLRLRERFAPESLEVAESLNNLGAVAFASGDLAAANEHFLRTLEIRERLAPGSLEVATSLNNLGVVADEGGDLRNSEGYLLRALQLREELAPESLDTASSLDNLGSLSLARGHLEVAQSYYLRALKIQERIAPDSTELAKTLNNLGLVSQHREDLDRARDYHLRALKIHETLAPRSLGVATTLSNLGTLEHDRGEFRLARRYFLQALEIETRLAPQSLAVASSLSNLGAAAQASGELDLAYDYYLQALKIEETLAPQSLDVAASLGLLGNLDLLRGELTRAQDYSLRALEIHGNLVPGSIVFARSLMNIGDVAMALGERESAQSYYLRALDTLEYQISKLGGSYQIQAGFRAKHRGYYRDTLEILLAQGHFAKAFHVLERFRAQTFLAMLIERDLAFTADIPENLDRERRQLSLQYDRALKELAHLNLRDHGMEIEAARRELQKLTDEAGDVEARIRSASPKLATLRYPQPLDATTTQQRLDPGTLLLSFSVGKDKTTLFALSRSGDLETKILPLGEETLRARAKQLLTLIPEAKGGSSLSEQRRTQLQAISRELYTELLAPVAHRIAASERLLILPDGPLHALPFAALIRDTEDGPQYLGAWKPLHVALSATVFAELKQGRRKDTVPAPLQLAAFGDPVYPQSLRKLKISAIALPAGGDVVRGDPTVRGAAERGLFDFQPLPYSRREVQGIAGLFPQGSARTFLGPEALEERIKSLDPNTRILHLSAHGSVDEHLPSGSFIALTIPEEAASAETGPQRDNGLLQVWEIFERVRLNADLVVLSACDTGLGEELGGEGLIGLTRAFQYAGARTVMASLWSVQDQATAELMIRFYKHLRAGLTKDRALQAAQQELLHGPIEVTDDKGERVTRDFSAPYYWAGFQLYGDWQ